jgi:hypothetical protein
LNGQNCPLGCVILFFDFKTFKPTQNKAANRLKKMDSIGGTWRGELHGRFLLFYPQN